MYFKCSIIRPISMVKIKKAAVGLLSGLDAMVSYFLSLAFMFCSSSLL